MSRIVLPVDTLGSSVPVPLWQQDRMLVLDYTEGDEVSSISWVAEQDDIVLIRAIGAAVDFVIYAQGSPVPVLRSRLVGQELAQFVKAGRRLDVFMLSAGRVELIPYDRSGDDFK